MASDRLLPVEVKYRESANLETSSGLVSLPDTAVLGGLIVLGTGLATFTLRRAGAT